MKLSNRLDSNSILRESI